MMRGIPGLPPSLLDPPPGCAFHPRCPHAMERCRVERPDLREVAPSTQAACHLCLIRWTSTAMQRSTDGRTGMTALLEARHVTRTFGGGLLDRTSTIGARGLLARDRRRPPVDHRDRRRERQRQDDAGAAAARPGRADGGRRCCTGARTCTALSGDRTACLPARRAGDLPGSVRGLQPVLPRRPRAARRRSRSSASPGSRAEGAA